MKPLDQCRLYTFIDEAYRRQRDYRDLAKALCDGGADVIQLRMKGKGHEVITQAAELIAPVTETYQVHLVINDCLEAASRLPHPFLHLGQEDFFDAGYQSTQQLKQPNRGIDMKCGLSTHAPDQAERAILAGADYIAIGPIYATPPKPTAQPVTLEYVRWASTHVAIPWFSIGGIQQSNLHQVMDAGARRICVVSDILNAENPQNQCQWYRDQIDTY